MDNFITDIHIGKVRHLENIDIKLGDSKKHLILTGKNGCGKTSVLEALNNFFLNKFIDKEMSEQDLKKHYNTLYPIFNKKELDTDDFIEPEPEYIYSFFKAKRGFKTSKSKGIQKIVLSKNKTERLNSYFLQYIVNLKAERSFARDDNELKIVKEIDEWFERFENILKAIYSDNSLSLKFDRRNIMSYNFVIEKKNREVFDFHSLSDGYSSIIDIITELLLKVEVTETRSLNIEGIVLIDEIETHLHVELQKNIMPLLISFFPNIQFIISIHSPFVLSSLSNAVIYDLESHTQVADVSGYSYEALVETYFNVDKYTDELKEKLSRYKLLNQKYINKKIDDNELSEYFKLESFFDKLPHYKNEELGYILKKIELEKIGI